MNIMRTIACEVAKYESNTGESPNALIIGVDVYTDVRKSLNMSNDIYINFDNMSTSIMGLRVILDHNIPRSFGVAKIGVYSE